MSKRATLIITGIAGISFILFVLFIYLPYADKQKKLNRVTESYQHSSYLKDSIKHIPDFSVTDQNGVEVTHKDLEDKVAVVNFFYTSCEGYCPTTTKHLATVQNALNDSIPFTIVSFSLNPEMDSIARLKKYAELYKANEAIWHFVRGEQEAIYALGEEGFLTIVKGADGSFEGHSDRFVLVDRSGNIRGFYRGTDSVQLTALLQDINYLVFKGANND